MQKRTAHVKMAHFVSEQVCLSVNQSFSSQNCKVCGENSVITDRNGEEELQVCMNCGSILSQQIYVSSSCDTGYQNPEYSSQNVPDHAKSILPKQDTKLYQQCKTRIKTLCSMLCFSSDMLEAAVQLFVRAYGIKDYKHMQSYNKQLLCYCCVYVVGRQFDLPITLKEFCMTTRQSVADVAHMYQKLLKDLSISLPYQGIASLITHHLSADEWFGREALDMVQDLLQLYERKRTTCSPHRDTIIGISAYLVWGSRNLEEYRNFSLKKFAKKHKFKFTSTWAVRLKEVKEILTEIGSHLPWISDTSSKHFVVNNLKDILKYQKSVLMQEAYKNGANGDDIDIGSEIEVNVRDEYETSIFSEQVYDQASLSFNSEELDKGYPYDQDDTTSQSEQDNTSWQGELEDGSTSKLSEQYISHDEQDYTFRLSELDNISMHSEQYSMFGQSEYVIDNVLIQSENDNTSRQSERVVDSVSKQSEQDSVMSMLGEQQDSTSTENEQDISHTGGSILSLNGECNALDQSEQNTNHSVGQSEQGYSILRQSEQDGMSIHLHSNQENTSCQSEKLLDTCIGNENDNEPAEKRRKVR